MSDTDIYQYDAGFILGWRRQRKLGFKQYIFKNTIITALILMPVTFLFQWWKFDWSFNIGIKDFFTHGSLFFTSAVLFIISIVRDVLRWRKSEKRYKQLRHIRE